MSIDFILDGYVFIGVLCILIWIGYVLCSSYVNGLIVSRWIGIHRRLVYLNLDWIRLVCV